MAPRIPVLVLLAALAAGGCSSAARRDRPLSQGEQDFRRVASTLRLELAHGMPTILQAGRSVTLTFVLRNVGEEGVDLCVGRGVSTFIQTDADAVWRILRWYGHPRDSGCRSRLHLEPQETRELAGWMALPRRLPPGSAKLRSMIAIELPSSCCGCRSGCAHGFVSGIYEVSVTAKPGGAVAAVPGLAGARSGSG